MGSSISAFFSRASTLSPGSPRSAEPAFLLGARGRQHEDQQRVREDLLDLLGPVDLDLEHDVLIAAGLVGTGVP